MFNNQNQFKQNGQLSQQYYNQMQQQQQLQQQHQVQQQQYHQKLPTQVDPMMLTQFNLKDEDRQKFDILNDISPLSPQPDSLSMASSPYGSHINPGFYSMSVPIQGNFPIDSKLSSNQSAFNSYQSNGISAASLDVEDPTARQSIEAINEKRRRRRESHNAVERRRRDHINEKIQELSSLLPEFASDAQNKPNKGIILRRSVEYIRHMQLFAARQMDRTLELEQCLMRLCQTKGINESELGLSVPLGTPIQLPAISSNEDHDD